MGAGSAWEPAPVSVSQWHGEREIPVYEVTIDVTQDDITNGQNAPPGEFRIHTCAVSLAVQRVFGPNVYVSPWYIRQYHTVPNAIIAELPSFVNWFIDHADRMVGSDNPADGLTPFTFTVLSTIPPIDGQAVKVVG